MTRMTRRAALIGLAGTGLVTPAHAAGLPADLAAHPGYAPWTPARARDAPLPLGAMIDTGGAQTSLREWLGGRPAVLALWATWCAPCLAEKTAQAAVARRLSRAQAPARILALQSFDASSLIEARLMLWRLRAADLTNARASAAAEAGLLAVFGPARTSRARPLMPSLALVGADGAVIAQAAGMLTAADGETSYWDDPATYEFLSLLS